MVAEKQRAKQRSGRLTVVVPAYNEAKNISKTTVAIEKILSAQKIAHEILFVDDGSSDDTWEIIKEESAKNQSIKGIKFSRNFGKESAIIAGLAEVNGDCAVVIDCDLQHPPVTILLRA